MAQKGASVICKIDKLAISKFASEHIEQAKALIIKRLSYIGEECVRIARQGGTYNDITGNLRSSIGYVILQDGQPIVNGEPQQFSGSQGNGAGGAKAAQTLLERIKVEFPKGIVLVVCAGMKYAAYVEDIHHKVVLSEAELKAHSLAKKLLNGVIG